MELFDKEVTVIEKPKLKKTNKIKSLQGYDAMRDKLKGNKLYVETPVEIEQPKKICIGL